MEAGAQNRSKARAVNWGPDVDVTTKAIEELVNKWYARRDENRDG